MTSHIALTNDDGIDAPGIRALHQAVTSLQDIQAVQDIQDSNFAKAAIKKAAIKKTAIKIVAPDQHLSGCSHQFNRGGPITVTHQAEQQYAISGTPADCTRIAHHLYPHLDWLLSGINDGGNLGADIHVSGTVAAVREATLLRIPAIAISHYKARHTTIDWDVAARRTAQVLTVLMERPLKPGQFWNINLPAIEPSAPEPDIVFCPVCTQPLPLSASLEADQFTYTGDYQQRQRDPGADVDVCFSGHISVSQVSLW